MISLNLRVNISILSIDFYYFNLNETFLITVLPSVENTSIPGQGQSFPLTPCIYY